MRGPSVVWGQGTRARDVARGRDGGRGRVANSLVISYSVIRLIRTNHVIRFVRFSRLIRLICRGRPRHGERPGYRELEVLVLLKVRLRLR